MLCPDSESAEPRLPSGAGSPAVLPRVQNLDGAFGGKRGFQKQVQRGRRV